MVSSRRWGTRLPILPFSQQKHGHTPCLVRGPQQGPKCGPHAPHWGVCTNKDFSFLASAPLEAPSRQHFPDPGSRDMALSPWENLTSKRTDFLPSRGGLALHSWLAHRPARRRRGTPVGRAVQASETDGHCGASGLKHHRTGRAGATCGNHSHTDPEGE